MSILREEDLFDTSWIISEIKFNNGSVESDHNHVPDVEGNYKMTFKSHRRRFHEEGNSDFILNGGWWIVENDILTVHNPKNKKINRNYEIIEYDEKNGKLTLNVIHRFNNCSQYKSYSQFVLKKVVE